MEKLRREMTAAADSLNFETAARLRDLIQGIERATERQQMISTELDDRDVIGLLADEVQACAALLQIRSGRVVGEEHHFLDGAVPGAEGEALCQFVEQHYQRRAAGPGGLPPQILLSHAIEDSAVVAEWMRGLRGGRVALLVPRRGEKHRLMGMALRNARLHLEERKNRVASDQARADEAMLELQESLGLSSVPYRIECYDISNTQGSQSVGAMVVFQNGQPARGEYRSFKIRSVDGPNDFASIQEVLGRRLKRGAEGAEGFRDLADLIVIDGGKGQLHAALEVEAELGVEIPTVGLAKRLEEVFLPGRSESILLPRASPALFLLQRIRDETHRFGITFHRKLRAKSQTRSVLDTVPGIGEKRRRALLKQFGSVDKMKQATAEELARTPGMSRPAAQQVFEALRR